MNQNHSALNSFSDNHNNRLQAEILGNDPNVNVFNAMIREGLGEDEADERHSLGMREPIFGKSVPRTRITSETFADNVEFMARCASEEPAEEEVAEDMAEETAHIAFLMRRASAEKEFAEDSAAATAENPWHIAHATRLSSNICNRPGHLEYVKPKVLERERLHKMLNAPSNKPVRQPRPNKVFNPRMPDEVPSHLQAVFALNAANRNKKGRGSNR